MKKLIFLAITLSLTSLYAEECNGTVDQSYRRGIPYLSNAFHTEHRYNTNNESFIVITCVEEALAIKQVLLNSRLGYNEFTTIYNAWNAFMNGTQNGGFMTPIGGQRYNGDWHREYLDRRNYDHLIPSGYNPNSEITTSITNLSYLERISTGEGSGTSSCRDLRSYLSDRYDYLSESDSAPEQIRPFLQGQNQTHIPRSRDRDRALSRRDFATERGTRGQTFVNDIYNASQVEVITMLQNDELRQAIAQIEERKNEIQNNTRQQFDSFQRTQVDTDTLDSSTVTAIFQSETENAYANSISGNESSLIEDNGEINTANVINQVTRIAQNSIYHASTGDDIYCDQISPERRQPEAPREVRSHGRRGSSK